MKVVYKNWEPNQGLEEIQAIIYRETKGLSISLDYLRQENNSREPLMSRFALTEDGKPLAHVDSTDSPSTPGKTYISYPWAVADCPSEVQEKIFNDLLKHLENREETLEIIAVVKLFQPIVDERFDFFQRHGFTEEHRQYLYNRSLNIDEVSRWKLSGAANNLTSRLATKDDYEHLSDLFKIDTERKRQFRDEKARSDYLEGRILKEGHVILLFDGDKAVAASAPLRAKPDGQRLFGDEERIVMRFIAMRPTYPYAWKRLVHEVAKECVRIGWTDISLEVLAFLRSYSSAVMGLEYIQPELMPYEAFLVFNKSEGSK